MSGNTAKHYEIEIDGSIIWLQTVVDCKQKIEYLKTVKPDMLNADQKGKLDSAARLLDDVQSSVIEGVIEFCEDWEELPGCKIWETPVIIKKTQVTEH